MSRVSCGLCGSSALVSGTSTDDGLLARWGPGRQNVSALGVLQEVKSRLTAASFGPQYQWQPFPQYDRDRSDPLHRHRSSHLTESLAFLA